MRRPIAVVAVCLAAGGFGYSAQAGAQEAPSTSCTPLKAVYAWKDWQDPKPLDGRSACPARSKAGARNTIRTFYLYRRYRQVATQPGLSEGDPWLRWLAVPAYIVRCETRGYYGRGRWRAANDSGAVGPYQLLGWGAPFPADSPAEKVANHEIAAGLSLDNWACA